MDISKMVGHSVVEFIQEEYYYSEEDITENQYEFITLALSNNTFYYIFSSHEKLTIEEITQQEFNDLKKFQYEHKKDHKAIVSKMIGHFVVGISEELDYSITLEMSNNKFYDIYTHHENLKILETI